MSSLRSPDVVVFSNLLQRNYREMFIILDAHSVPWTAAITLKLCKVVKTKVATHRQPYLT